jgi:hypothetical protein
MRKEYWDEGEEGGEEEGEERKGRTVCVYINMSIILTRSSLFSFS